MINVVKRKSLIVNRMLKKPFVILDLETSGIDPKKNDIIEVALIRYEDGKEVDRYDDLIKIDYELPEIITVITGITDKDLQEKGKASDKVLKKVEQLIAGAYLVGHNINFDFNFLKAKKVKMNILGLIDTIPLAQILFPQAASYSLESLTDDFKIKHKHKHRAMGDVEATLDLFKYLWKNAGQLPKKLIGEIKEFIPRSTWDGGVFFEEVMGGHIPPSEGEQSIVRLQKGEYDSFDDKNQGTKQPLEIDKVFGDDGVMAQCWDEYEVRPQQAEMAQNVLNAFGQNYHLICEAPTGVGKSLAYLMAAANVAIKNKSKVVITTNTINLQQQLYDKDVPRLHEIYKHATDHPGVRVAVLKGRSHYLCLRRLAEFKRRPNFTPEELILLIKILVWQYMSESGDSSEIHLTRPETMTWDFELCADQKYCTPQKCKSYGKCYLQMAREKAEEADIIIVNHALLCADLEAEGSLLPDYQYLVIDEAHHFEEVTTKSFGIAIKQENFSLPIKVIKNHLENLQRRFEGTLFVSQTAFEDIDPILEQIPDLDQLLDNFFSVLAIFVNRNVPDSGYIENLLIDKVVSASQEWMNLGESLEEVSSRLEEWIKSLRQLAETMQLTDDQQFPEQDTFADGLLQEVGLLKEQLTHLKNFFDEDHQATQLIRWAASDYNGIVAAHMAPLMVGPLLKEKLYDEKKSIILTSATLGVKLANGNGAEQHPFTYLRQMLGLDEHFEEIILDSPFNFETQAYVIVPNDLLPITATKSIQQISDFLSNLIKSVGGSLMGLFTSYSAIENIYLNLIHTLSRKDTKLLAQRINGGRNKIMKAYMNNPTNSVLFGTNSFWEGVDIPGDALTSVVIHKLPFDVPSNPIYKVRQEMFTNGFFEYTIPRSILRFRQGFGRLIRSTKDYGVMVVLDNRVLTKEYGKMFLKALPENITIEKMPLAEIPGKVEEWLIRTKE